MIRLYKLYRTPLLMACLKYQPLDDVIKLRETYHVTLRYTNDNRHHMTTWLCYSRRVSLEVQHISRNWSRDICRRSQRRHATGHVTAAGSRCVIEKAAREVGGPWGASRTALRDGPRLMSGSDDKGYRVFSTTGSSMTSVKHRVRYVQGCTMAAASIDRRILLYKYIVAFVCIIAPIPITY